MALRNIEDLVENFALFTDWEERYGYLIELGKGLQPMEEAMKNDHTFVRGCTSRVWMVAEKDDQGRYHFTADSDAHIVRGLIALLLSAYQEKTAEEIAAVDIEKIFTEIGLHEHLSPNRRNGFFAMVGKIKSLSLKGEGREFTC